jgi:Fe-S cluster assembly protein SufB
VSTQHETDVVRGIRSEYEYGWSDPEEYFFKSPRGLSHELIDAISEHKSEPQWMREFRHRSLDYFLARPMPSWGADLSGIDFDNIYYYIKPTEKQASSWEELPAEIRETWDKLGIPEAEKRYLAGVGAQYESEVVYHKLQADLEEKGVIFLDMDSGLREHEELVKQYFGTVIPQNDNKFAALNSAVWSGGSFIYVPPGVSIEMPLQAYFRINAENMGQFERTLIIVDENAYVHYVEGCHLAGSMVRVRDGEKPIEDVVIGDEVLTHEGRFRPVRDTMSRRFEGPIFRITFAGESYRSLAVTPRHPFLVATRKRERDHNTSFEPEWREAWELRKGDYLALPVSIDLERDVPGAWGQDVLVGSGRHAPVAERVEVELTPATCRVLGLYVAEGSVSANTSYLAFDSATNEENLRDLVEEVMEDAFGLEAWEYRYEGREGRSLRYSSVRAARFFAQTFGRTTSELRVPDWLFALDDEQRAAFVRGLYDGEGSYDGVLDLYRINQTNRHVAQRLRELLLSLGIRASLSRSERAAPRKPMWQVAICKADNPLFEELVLRRWETVERRKKADVVIADGYLWMPIRSIEKTQASCTVYNLSVEEDESYVCEGVVSHNCTAPIYSSDSLHSAVVEIIVKKGGRCRYTTIQNWSNNVYNLVTKRAVAYEGATMEWVDGNLGCLSGDAQVFTNPSGPRALAELAPGDKVYAFDLERMRPVRRKVLGFKESGIQAVYGVETKNHRQIKATANHPFLVLDRATPEGSATLEWKMLYDIHPGDRIGVIRGLPDDGTSRDLSEYVYRGNPRGRPRTALRLPSETSEDLLWLLGAYMGGGYMERNAKGVANRVYFAVPPGDEARAKLEARLASVFGVKGRQKGPVSLVVASTVLADFLLWLDLAGTARTKRIPGWIWGLPVAERLAFIEGYLDTDGHVRNVRERDGVRYGQITFVSANRELLEDLKLLAIGCGLTPGKISRYVKDRKLTLGKEVKEYVSYSLSMNLRENLEAIRSHRAPAMRLEFVPVKEITPLPAEPTYDIEVDGAHNFVANGLLVHNSKVTMKYPAIWLMGEGAHGEVLSIAFAGKGQHQDAGGKVVHVAPRTSSVITSKSISKDGGRAGYRGLLQVAKGAVGSKSKVVCDALILDEESRSDTYPYIQVDESEVDLGHEATVSKIGEEQLFYLMSRGLSEAEASAMIVSGFVEPITKELPLEYAVEMNRLIQLQMEGSVG